MTPPDESKTVLAGPYERKAARFMFTAYDAMRAAREQWAMAGRTDLIEELEPHYDAICEMGLRPSR